MTWSILARDPRDGALGLAVASRFFAVGALVLHSRADCAVASQAFLNPLWGLDGIAALAGGGAAEGVLAALVARDGGAAHRQAHLLDRTGRVAAHTGEATVGWAGHLTGEGVSVAGNMLAGGEVIRATFETWQTRADLAIDDRLLAAMRAGEAAGGDKRGRQAAALRVHRGEDYPALDIRADDHRDPLGELDRLLAVSRERFVHFARMMGTRADFSGAMDRGAYDRVMAERDRALAAREAVSRSAADPPDG